MSIVTQMFSDATGRGITHEICDISCDCGHSFKVTLKKEMASSGVLAFFCTRCGNHVDIYGHKFNAAYTDNPVAWQRRLRQAVAMRGNTPIRYIEIGCELDKT